MDPEWLNQRLEKLIVANRLATLRGGFDGFIDSHLDEIKHVLATTDHPERGMRQACLPVRCIDTTYSAAYVARALCWKLNEIYAGVKNLKFQVGFNSRPDPDERGKMDIDYYVEFVVGKYSFTNPRNLAAFQRYWKHQIFDFFNKHPNNVPESQCCLRCPHISLSPKQAMPLVICECAKERAELEWITHGPPIEWQQRLAAKKQKKAAAKKNQKPAVVLTTRSQRKRQQQKEKENAAVVVPK
jgi:hypothetical protein